MSAQKMNEPVEGEDYYCEGEYIVFTREFHLKRGQCCGSNCRHCPYQPRWIKGATQVGAQVVVKTTNHLPG